MRLRTNGQKFGLTLISIAFTESIEECMCLMTGAVWRRVRGAARHQTANEPARTAVHGRHTFDQKEHHRLDERNNFLGAPACDTRLDRARMGNTSL